MRYLLLALALVACSDSTAPNPVSIDALEGSYALTKYNASDLTAGQSGTLSLRSDSTYTLTGTSGVPNLSGRWTVTAERPRGTIYLYSGARFMFGYVEGEGLGFGGYDFPALHFRKR